MNGHTPEGRKRILLVDDIELNRVLTEAVLAAAAFEVDCVDDGAQALRAVETKSYDLVLMDLDMPGLDGYQAAAAIRQTRPKAPPIAALSSRNSAAERDRVREVGMTSHLARPIAPRDLLRAVTSLLAETQPTEAPVFRQEIQNEIIDRLGADRTRGFLETLLAHCSALRRVLPSDDAEVERMTHDLASTAGMLGYENLSHCCRNFLIAPTEAERGRALAALEPSLSRTTAVLMQHVLPPALPSVDLAA